MHVTVEAGCEVWGRARIATSINKGTTAFNVEGRKEGRTRRIWERRDSGNIQLLPTALKVPVLRAWPPKTVDERTLPSGGNTKREALAVPDCLQLEDCILLGVKKINYFPFSWKARGPSILLE